ncbi:MAG TPA: SBBP repeat-containing protein, partial [Gemmataceae bacterium]|nr:SBBP repeat-containing protein [Gemmataceae bacterium]
MPFERNVGQFNSTVEFAARGQGYTLLLSATGANLVLQDTVAASGKPVPGANQQTVVGFDFVGANPNARIEGVGLLPGHTNDLHGNDPSHWHTNIANFRSVRYTALYPGIDLVFYGANAQARQVEYDFLLKPGADPSVIHLALHGALDQHLDSDGTLIQSTPGGEVAHLAPTLYQSQDDSRAKIAAQYVLQSGNQIGFEVKGAWDRTKTLTIDPVIDYKSHLGGTSPDVVQAIAVEPDGTAYATGSTPTADLPADGEATIPGGLDAFLTKINSDGVPVVTTYFGGTGDDSALAVTLAGSDKVAIAGTTWSNDLPTSTSSYQGSLQGNSDAFVGLFERADLSLVDASYYGGAGDESARGVATDAAGNLFLSGITTSANLPVPQGFQTTYGGGQADGFVARMNSSLSALAFGSYLGGSGNDEAHALAVTASGTVYLAGSTSSTGLGTSGTAQSIYGGGTSDAFAARVTVTSGTPALDWFTYAGGQDDDAANGIAVDASGNVALGGWTRSPNFPWLSPFLPEVGGGTDGFVGKLNSTGSAWIYATPLGGSGDDVINALAVDSAGFVYVAGTTNSTELPQIDPVQFGRGGLTDAFVARLGAWSSDVLYCTYVGGWGQDEGQGLALDRDGSAYLAGRGDSPGLASNFGTGSRLVVRLRNTKPAIAGMTPDSGSLAYDLLTTAQNVQLFGHAQPGSTVQIHNATSDPTGTPLGTVTADSAGLWSFTTATASESVYAFTAAHPNLAGDTGREGQLGTQLLTDTTKEWTLNEWTGYLVEITSGPQAGVQRHILNNDDTTLFLSSAWLPLDPGDSPSYRIFPATDPNLTGDTGSESELGMAGLFDNTKAWTL